MNAAASTATKSALSTNRVVDRCRHASKAPTAASGVRIPKITRNGSAVPLFPLMCKLMGSAAVPVAAIRNVIRGRWGLSIAAMDGLGTLAVVGAVKFMCDGVAFAPRDQPAVGQPCRAKGDREPERDAPPELCVAEPRVERTGNEEDEEVVNRLHDRDRNRVRCERNAAGLTETDTGAQDRLQCECVAEEECQGDREDDLHDVSPAESGCERHAHYFADHTARQAMGGRREGSAIETLLSVSVQIAGPLPGALDFSPKPPAHLRRTAHRRRNDSHGRRGA